jgi:hypothetical protein
LLLGSLVVVVVVVVVANPFKDEEINFEDRRFGFEMAAPQHRPKERRPLEHEEKQLISSTKLRDVYYYYCH